MILRGPGQEHSLDSRSWISDRRPAGAACPQAGSVALRNVARRLGILFLSTSLGQVGCVSGPAVDAGGPRRVTLRFFEASPEPRAGYRPITDEAGQRVYVATEPLLTERDVREARVYSSAGRALLRLQFSPFAAVQLERQTTENFGTRLAVFVNERLVMSPSLIKPIRSGRLYLDGDFTRTEAEQLATALNRLATTAEEQPTP